MRREIMKKREGLNVDLSVKTIKVTMVS